MKLTKSAVSGPVILPIWPKNSVTCIIVTRIVVGNNSTTHTYITCHAADKHNLPIIVSVTIAHVTSGNICKRHLFYILPNIAHFCYFTDKNQLDWKYKFDFLLLVVLPRVVLCIFRAVIRYMHLSHSKVRFKFSLLLTSLTNSCRQGTFSAGSLIE